MAASGGVNASFSFAGSTFDTSSCLQNTQIQRTMNQITYNCAGVQQYVAGAKVYLFTYQMALASTDTASVAALAEGTTGTFEYHPGGDTAGNIEMTSTKGTSVQMNISAAVNGIITIDGQIGLNDLTDATAT